MKKKEVSKARKITATVLCTIVIIFTIVFIIAIISEDVNYTNSNKLSTTETTDKENNTHQEQTEKVIYSDDNFKVTYVDFIDPKSGVTAFNLLLKIENNSDKEIIVALSDGYANNTAVFFGSGMPVKIKPNKNAVGAFVLGYANTGITSIDEIKTLEFKIVLYNETFSEKILETNNITLNL